ncbi:hypothetical protein PAPYR_1398 [Paratrimastix pyriformis]|uniref:Transmembrane protein 131-like N-terminal domain-containing protein n=1 Tax=Paratrimastix pyriformis TaxID=342808 RepID=A0ABQ8UWT0_9EUKA|nr:hypothetical protein PAPYR_1398 [Paratrimastix pyriformis]
MRSTGRLSLWLILLLFHVELSRSIPVAVNSSISRFSGDHSCSLGGESTGLSLTPEGSFRSLSFGSWSLYSRGRESFRLFNALNQTITILSLSFSELVPSFNFTSISDARWDPGTSVMLELAFLPRSMGLIEEYLTLHTTLGDFSFQVLGVSSQTPNQVRLFWGGPLMGPAGDDASTALAPTWSLAPYEVAPIAHVQIEAPAPAASRSGEEPEQAEAGTMVAGLQIQTAVNTIDVGLEVTVVRAGVRLVPESLALGPVVQPETRVPLEVANMGPAPVTILASPTDPCTTHRSLHHPQILASPTDPCITHRSLHHPQILASFAPHPPNPT